MAEKKKHVYIRLPVGLKEEIDAIAGPRKRSAFIAEAAEREIQRRKSAASSSEQRDGK